MRIPTYEPPSCTGSCVIPENSNVVVMMSSQNIYTISSVFKLQSPASTLNLTSPSQIITSGFTGPIYRGSVYTVTWQSTGFVRWISIELRDCTSYASYACSVNVDVATPVTANGSVSWTAPMGRLRRLSCRFHHNPDDWN
jgi:hypothetical protein